MDKISLRLGLNSGADLREGLGMHEGPETTLLTLFLYIKILAFFSKNKNSERIPNQLL